MRVASDVVAPGPVLDRALVADLPERLRQPTFTRTGGLHATGLFTADGELVCVREDVGRHNAMDKVIGWALREGIVPLHPHVLCVSGRLSFELVQKAAVAGAPLLVGVGAPTSLAVSLADDRGLTLCGFARGGRVNVYTAPERIGPGSGSSPESSNARERVKRSWAGPWKSAEPVISRPRRRAAACSRC